MMARFCAYIDKVFHFREQAATLTDSRPQPVIPTQAVFATAFTMFATGRGSLGLFSERAPGQWTEGRQTVQYWDEEGFTSCEGVAKPLRVLHTLETVQRRERIAGQWKETEETHSWYWATSFSQRQLPTRELWRAGHWRWDIENGCFNTTSTHWGLDHVFKHHPVAIVNFVLTLFVAFILLQCFWQRNLKPPFRNCFTRIGLVAELYLGLAGRGCYAPQARAP